MAKTFEDIPLEVQEHIFLNLSPADLINCSYVCSKWHDVINSNQIWLKMSGLEGLAKKKFLDDSCSLMTNPIKQFGVEAKFSHLCHWKSHFNRYKFVKRNLRIGYFVRSPVRFTPIHMNEQFLIQQSDSQLIMWDILGKLKRTSSIEIAIPDMKVDLILWKGEYIVYTQQRYITCIKKSDNACNQVLHAKLEPGNCSQMRRNCLKTHITIRLSEKFLLVQDPLNPCVLTFFDYATGKLVRKIDLHRVLGNQSIYCSCLEALGDIVILAYQISNNPFMIKYRFGDDTWESPISLPNEAMELYLSSKYLCVKLTPESRETPVSLLQIWDHTINPQSSEELHEFYASKHLPVVLTESGHIIYHSCDEIKIHDLMTRQVNMFNISRGVMKFTPLWESCLVILDEKGVSVWNWWQGKKINTPYRDDCCSTFFVSETNIIIRRDDEQFFLISYW